MGKRVSGIHHVALKCQNQEEFNKTINFYHDILGMEIIRTWGDGKESGIMLSAGNALVEIFANADRRLEQGAIRHIALATDNPDECIEEVKKAGYQIIEEPHDIEIPSNPKFLARIAFAYGPVGEEIEFFCEK